MIAITGAAGFIGSNLAHRLAGTGHALWLIDHSLDSAKASNLVGIEEFRFSTPDRFLLELGAAERAPVQVIFHLGACSSTTEMNWDFLYRNNVEFSRRLWRWCCEARCPFYYASSAATYGDGSVGFSDRMQPTELTPLNLYGKSKNDFDRWVLEELDRGAPSPPGWAGLKFFNVYGPRETHKKSMSSVVWHARRQLLETGEIRLFRSNHPDYADGEQRRDFVFVEDCIDHICWLWERPAITGLFNSGSGTARTFLDLAKAVCVALGREPRIRFVEMPDSIGRQYQNFTLADMSKLRVAGYAEPATALEDGVRLAIAAEDSIRCTSGSI